MTTSDYDLVRQRMANPIRYIVFEKDGVKRLASKEEWDAYFEKYGLVAAMRDFSNVVESGIKLEETEYYRLLKEQESV